MDTFENPIKSKRKSSGQQKKRHQLSAQARSVVNAVESRNVISSLDTVGNVDRISNNQPANIINQKEDTQTQYLMSTNMNELTLMQQSQHTVERNAENAG
jgi:hypothetical protein